MTECFLMTNNYLIPHKQYYCTKKILIDDLFVIIRDSVKVYKKELKIDAEEEIEHNKSITDIENHRFSKQNLYKEFKNFDHVELEMSIKMINFDSEKIDGRKIFLEKPRKRYY